MNQDGAGGFQNKPPAYPSRLARARSSWCARGPMGRRFLETVGGPDMRHPCDEDPSLLKWLLLSFFPLFFSPKEEKCFWFHLQMKAMSRCARV